MNKSDNQSESSKTDKKTRRRFLQDLSFASLGTALALSQTDKVLARWLNKKTTDHVAHFLKVAESARVTESSTAELSRAALNVINVINTDEAAQSTFERFYTELSNNNMIEVPRDQPTTELGLPLKISDAVTAAFLYALKQLENGLPSIRKIKEDMADPVTLLSRFEPEFIRNLADKISNDWRSVPELSSLLNSATARFNEVASSIYEEAILTSPPTDCGCWAGGPNGEGCLSTVQCIVIVVIIVVLIVVSYFV